MIFHRKLQVGVCGKCQLTWPGRVAEWVVRKTNNPMIVGSSLTGASNILRQDGQCPAMLSVKRLAMYSTRGGSQAMYITFAFAM